MNALCGCCEGIEPITPVSHVNRPGLNSLVYRVGTHATFLETMLARLASHSFDTSQSNSPEQAAARIDPHGQKAMMSRAHPLHGLATREGQDPAIAFLDAWATVADVLTFYQERFANEAYLRTAIERRSILELAWLVGYQPRPGVAASTYLAYSLEPAGEVIILAGTRAQSVPGPEELPQPFETAEDLYARGDWNTLQPRLTRPQIPKKLLDLGKPLYFKGTATNLKENDPLLIVSGEGSGAQEPYRVIKVEPDQAADWTKVTLQPWLQQFVATLPGPILELAQQPLEKVKGIIARYVKAEDFEVNSTTQMAQRVLQHLDDLDQSLKNIGADPPEELRRILNQALPLFREEHRLAREANFTKLEPWVGDLISELEEVSESLVANEDEIVNQPSLTKVSRLISALEKPASLHPASKQQLGLSTEKGFSSASDTLSKMLVALRPPLGRALYRAWENLPVTTPVASQAYALRTRASVFGHNAPLKPITNPDNGRIERYEEWTLFRPKGPPVSEGFRIGIEPTAEDKITINIVITGRGTSASGSSGPQPLTNGDFNIDLTGAAGNEVVAAILRVNASKALSPLTLRFPVRGVTVRIEVTSTGELIVASSGSDPTKVTIKLTNLNARGRIAAGSKEPIVIEGEIRRLVDEEPTESPNVVSLDASYSQILPGSWVVLERPTPLPGGSSTVLIRRIVGVNEASRADYLVTGKGTQLGLDTPWIAPVPSGDTFDEIRGTAVLAQSELLELAEAPIDPVLEAVCGARIELANLVNGLEPGRWLIVSGERADVKPDDETGESAAAGSEATDDNTVVPGVKAAELVMLAGIEQGYNALLPGDKTHTTLLLAQSLAYCYKRDTVKIYGNVIPATHGETRDEILGSGNASQALQSFVLRQSPLTYLSAPNPAGAETTLQVRINEVLWHETDSLAGLGHRDRNYVTKTNDESKTTIIFGNGYKGARLATGTENVRAVYRSGIGKGGNVKAEQITLLTVKPLGVKEVINPLPATGGANRESRDDARRNAPLAVMSLDRLVSTRDYEDFARTFAGVGKASAARLSDGLRQVVHLTIAGADDIPISANSDLYRNLRTALSKFGDPFQPVQVATCFLKLLVVSANVRIHPDYIWESVEPKIRAAMLERFSFNQRDLGQDVVLSEVIGTIQSIEGVVYVDVDTLDDLPEDITAETLVQISSQLKLYQRIRAYLAQVDKTALDPSVRIRPAQLCLLSPLVSDTLILRELKR